MAALECSPIVKVGGVADAVAGLSHALVARGHTVTVALPADQREGALRRESFEVRVLGVESFEPRNPYGHEHDETGEGAQRLARLTAAVLGLIASQSSKGQAFDVVHCHEWPLGLVPHAMRRAERRRPASVFTIHNGSFHGTFPPDSLGVVGVTEEVSSLPTAPGASSLAVALRSADALTTVSPTYARELLQSETGFGLDQLLARRGSPLVGVLNGLDTVAWDPSMDPALVRCFDAESLAGRAACRSALLASLGLQIGPPLVAYAGRLFKEKGADVLWRSIPALLEVGVSVAVAGAGDAPLERRFREASARFPERVSYLGLLDEPGMKRLLAAADIVVIPSRREACGLVQMQAQRYGAIPVAHRTGGLVDTVTDPADGSSPTGFLFDEPTVDGLMNGVCRALAVFGSPAWPELQRRCLRLDRSWERAAAAYERVYLEAVESLR